jgi:hypothetical protein
MSDPIYDVVRQRAAADKAREGTRRCIDETHRDVVATTDTVRASRHRVASGAELLNRIGKAHAGARRTR